MWEKGRPASERCVVCQYMVSTYIYIYRIFSAAVWLYSTGYARARSRLRSPTGEEEEEEESWEGGWWEKNKCGKYGKP